MGDSTVDGKGNKEEEENFFQQGCDMLWWIGDGGWQESCLFFQDVWPYQGHVC